MTVHKVLYVVSTLARVGPVKQLFNIISNLDDSRFAARVITLSPEPKSSLWASFVKKGINVRSLQYNRMQGALQALREVRSTVDTFKPDIVHTQGIRADMIAARLTNVLRVATLRNFPQLDYTSTYGSIAGRLMAYQHIKALRKLDVIVGVSDAVSHNLSEKYSLRASTIPNGLDISRFHPIEKREIAAAKAQLMPDINPSARVWITSGNIVARKDPRLILTAWEKAFLGRNDEHLIFLGEGSQLSECRSSAGKNVHFFGSVDNVQEYLQVSDIYVSASRAEGLPNAVLEAMASRLPVLLSNINPHQEIWEKDSRIGKLFPVGDASALASRMLEMSRSDLTTMGIYAEKLASSEFSAPLMSQRYQALYESMLGGSLRSSIECA